MSSNSVGKTVMVQGRIVWGVGDLFKGRVKTDMQTRQPLINPKTGEKIMEYGFGLAVPKQLLSQMGEGQPGHIWAAMHQEALTLFPSGQIPPSFAMKYKDGDTIDDQGVPFAQRAGYAGCLVFALTTRIPIKWFRYENGQNIMISEGVKCGDYVNVQVNVKAHPAVGTAKAGLYLNPMAVQFLGYGEEIINSPSGDQIFGVQAPGLPPGASAMPIAPQGQIVPTMPMQPAAPPAVQQPVAPSPHYGVLPQIHQPPAGGVPMQPAAPMPGPQPAAYPAPAVGATPMGAPMAPSFVSPAGMPPLPGAYQQR